MRITIIGGGASGTLLAINLLGQYQEGHLEINMVEKRGAGGGVAFSTEHELHLLNVPAAKMSALPDEPDHFINWLTSSGLEYDPTDFVPRHLFGRYLKELLADRIENARGNVSLNLIRDEAQDVAVDGRSANVVLRSGVEIRSDQVVLAFGNFPPPHPSVHDLKFSSSEKYVHDIWSADAFLRVRPQDDILIVGTGLSMVDVVLKLDSAGHHGKLYALSTKGLLPAVHKLGYSYPTFYRELDGVTRITEIFRKVRRHISAAEADGSDWRAVIDSLRPHTQAMWTRLPRSEKRYFLQHLSRHWNVARHRMPPSAAVRIDQLILEDKLRLLKGRLRHISLDESGEFLVNYAEFGKQSYLTVDVLVNCIGSEANFAKIDSELVRNLLSSRHIRCDPVNQGLDATTDGWLIDGSGYRSSVLRTLGTALKGVLWETTAIPEIRAQAQEMALDICRHLSDKQQRLAQRAIE